MYSSKTKHYETKDWFSGLLRHLARKRLRPILQLPQTTQGNRHDGILPEIISYSSVTSKRTKLNQSLVAGSSIYWRLHTKL